MTERSTSFAKRDPGVVGAYETRAYLCREKRFLAVWFTKSPQTEESTRIRPAGIDSMGGYYTARTQRVVILD